MNLRTLRLSLLSTLAAAGFMAALLASSVSCATAQSTGTPVTPNLSSAQIVDRMEHNNQMRADNLKHFTALRHYSLEYIGFPKNVSASLDVELNFDAPSTKKFRVVGQSGSKYIVDHVLMKLVEGERDASHEKHSTALTHENYRFQLVGTEAVGGRTAYVLSVEPLTESKYLYRGKIWVDAADFAVMKIDAEPSKSPSMWISQTQIHHVYEKTGDFWLPETNRSETKVRIGGNAVLTINYGKYENINEVNLQTASAR
jgi:hypothetical protein